MAPIESPVAPPTFGSFGRSTGPRLRATGLARFHRFANGCQTWTPGMFARCGDGTCDCCPYGYHIDLDFVRFCESLKDTAGYQSYLEHLQALKRGKREQRKALEEVYACPQLLFHPRANSPSAKDHSGSVSEGEMTENQHLLLRHLQQNQHHFPFSKKTRPPIPFWWLCDVATPTAGQRSDGEDAEQDHDSLTDVIQDFEDTLQSSHGDTSDTPGKTGQSEKAGFPRKGTAQGSRGSSLEPILLEKRLPPDGGDSISDFKANTKLTEEQCRRHVYTEEEQRKAEQLLDMIFGDEKLGEDLENGDIGDSRDGHRRRSTRSADVSRQRSDSVSSSESIDTISSLNYPSSSNSSASRQLETTMASLSPVGSEFSERDISSAAVGNLVSPLRTLGGLMGPRGSTSLLSSCGSTRVTIDRAVLAKIRDQLSACLVKMRDLELQAKDVPVLQVKMSVLKEEKRLLKLQLKAKNNLRDGRVGAGAHERSMSSTTGVSTAGSSLSVASAGRSHPGDESLRGQSRLPTTPGAIHPPPPPPPPSLPLMSLQSPIGSRGPPLPKLEPLKVEELPSPTTNTSATSPVRPSKLDALQTSASGTKHSRGHRSEQGGSTDEDAVHSSGVSDTAIGSPLKDQLWDETTGEPKYKSDQKGVGGRASDSALGDYLTEATVNPEPLVIPKHYHHTGINCCAETRNRATSTEGVRTRNVEVGSTSPLPPFLRDDKVGSKTKTLCDQCQEELIRPKRYPRTNGTQTMAEKPTDCVECVERRKRPLHSTAVNTDVMAATPEPPKKATKEAFTFDVCDGTSFTPKSTPFCAECDRRRAVRSYSVGSSTEALRMRDSGCDPVPELKPVAPKKAPPTPPPKPATFTRGIGVQCTTAITASQAVQVTPERVRTRHAGAQSDWRAFQRAQGTQTLRTESDRSKKLDTNSVASGDYDVRHAVCDACTNKRLRSIGTGEIAIYDMCCNRCAASNKRDGSVQCELLALEACDVGPLGEGRLSQQDVKKVEMKDQEVLTDDPYCDEITELIAIPCERCDVERRDFGFGDEDVFAAEASQQVSPPTPVSTEEVGVMTDHSIIEPLSFPPVGATATSAGGVAGGTALSRTSSASSMSHLTGNVRLCDKCSCAIESVAKDFIDQNLDHLVAEVTNDPPVPTLQSRIPKLSHTRGPRAPPRRTKPAPFDSVSRSLRRDTTPSSSTTAAAAIGSLDEQPITASQTTTVIPEPVERLPGEKHNLSREMESACLILNEYLQRPEKSDPNKLKAGLSRIQTEWFGATSGPDTDPAYVHDILEELDKMSNHLLHRVVNMADNNGNTALHYAVSHGNFSVVTRLLDSRATDVNKQNRAGYTPVMLAALATLGANDATQRATVHRLFQMGDVNAKASQNGQTALMLAASHGRADMVKALLEAGADPNTQDNDGSTALMCAAEHGYIDVVRILLANPDVEINIADHDGQTALSIAMEAGHKDTALLIYASSNFSRGSSPYSSLRGRKSRISPRATPPPSRPSRTPPPPGPSRPSRTPPPPSPSRSRKGSTSSVSSFSRAWF